MFGSRPVKFRASAVGDLLVGGNAITEKQLEKLEEYEARMANPNAKPLTVKQLEEMESLQEKRDADFKFGLTALSCIRRTWLRNEFGYEEPLVTDEIVKGIMCEDEAIDLLSTVVPGGYRVKNEQEYEDDHFTGTPDLITGDIVEDTKCSWSLRTFIETTKPDPLYYAQGQVYMALTGRSRFRLAHVLVETPQELVLEEKKRLFFKFNCDEENQFYQNAAAKVDAMHAAVAMVPKEMRVRCFEFNRDDSFIATLRQRVELARVVYDQLTIGGYSE